MKKPLVALMQPSAGRSVPLRGAVESFLRPTARGIDRLELKQGTSMLTRCFNLLLCDAMNASRHHPFTHLAFLHDDVAPEVPWLDVLLDEQARTGADMVSVLVPIKNHHGLTSTAAATPGDPWLSRRICLREAFDLPETLGIEDVPWREPGSFLLPNTGCWLMRWDMDFLERFADPARRGDGQSGFRFLNRIVKAPDGQYTSQDVAEDWDFGRQLHELGKRAVVTRKVPLVHEQPQFHNRSAWGDWPTDLGFLEYRRLMAGQRTPAGWVFPSEVDGWLTETEGRCLGRLAEGKAVLEVGSYCGRSTICLAQTAREVHAVDTFDGRATDKPGKTLARFVENLCRYGLMEKVTTYQGTASEGIPAVEGPVDLAFIDGAHDAPSVRSDAALALPKLAPGGLLAFHDYRTAPGEHDGRWDPGVTEAVNELLADGLEMVERAGSVAVLRRRSA